MRKVGLTATLGALLLNSSVFAVDLPSVNVKYTEPTPEVKTATESVLGVVRWAGFIVAIAMIIWIGIKYLTAGAGQKAEVKSTMVPLLVGAALVALAPVIATWIFTAVSAK